MSAFRQRHTGWWHGGPHIVGTHILPAAVTGVRGTGQITADLPDSATAVDDRKVCVTNNRNAALLFAAAHRTPWIYEVEPLGDLEPDPDYTPGPDGDPFRSMRCDRALIVRRFKPSNADVADMRRSIAVLNTAWPARYLLGVGQ